MSAPTTYEGPNHRGLVVAKWTLLATTVVATYVGWRTFWFLTDDSMIAFRYVSNSIAGRGLVWNPPPFAPVEGYTSFLWCVLLEWTWRLTGVAPPDASNWLSLGFGYGTLGIGFLIFRRAMEDVRDDKTWFAALVLVTLLVLCNRTFLTWLSSGLETSLFNFCITWWVFEAIAPARSIGRGWLIRYSSAATALALARPDGILFVAATVVQVALRMWRKPRTNLSPSQLVWCAPLALVVAHLIWRRVFYGDWLPNTFYAKYTGPAPERGMRFLLSFVIEYAMWWPLLLFVVAGYRNVRHRAGRLNLEATWIPFVPLAILVAFYSVGTGGDHFEYRVFSYLPLLVAIAASRMTFHGTGRPRAALACLVAYLLLSLPIPWTHWLETRDETQYSGPLFRPIAGRFPTWTRPVISLWDGLQSRLIEEAAGVRHQEHKTYFAHRSSFFPTREIGAGIPWDTRPVHVTGSVGIVGWVLPNVAIIDYLGLNDRVIARTPPTHPNQLAHARRPPQGYVDCFSPNVLAENHVLAVDERVIPLTDERIIECEGRDWSTVPPNLELELRRTRERRKRMYEIILDDQSGDSTAADP